MSYSEEHMTRLHHHLNSEVYQVEAREGEVMITYEPDMGDEAVSIMVPPDLVDALHEAMQRTVEFIYDEAERHDR